MADATVQKDAEEWVRDNFLEQHFSKSFTRRRMVLRTRGIYNFDAVSSDEKIVCTISTSGAKTSGGKLAVGKMHKLRSDILFLTMLDVPQRFVVLTELDMFDEIKKELDKGRIPQDIQLLHARLPVDLMQKLIAARRVASDEVTPSQDERIKAQVSIRKLRGKIEWDGDLERSRLD